eukprot:464047_1
MKIQQINDEISEIIQQRCKSKEEQKSALPTPQIDKINISLINEISSWLDLKSLSYFERCNRTIFIASRSPTQFDDIDDNTLEHYLKHCAENNQLIDVNRFRNVKSLTMGDEYGGFDKWPLSKADQIHNITLYPLAMHSWEGSYSEEDITEILQSMPNLKNLELTDFNFKQITFPIKDKLNVFKKLECLSLNHLMNGIRNNNDNENED